MIHSGALPHLDNVHIDWPLWQNVKLENGTRLPDEKHAEFRWHNDRIRRQKSRLKEAATWK